MKKLIIILFLIPFSLFSQIELSESYAFKADKGYHIIAGTGINAGTFLYVYSKTKDENLAFRAGIIITSFAAIGKESFDMLNGRPISLADMSYSIGSAILTGFIFKRIIIHRKKKKEKRRMELYNIEFQ